MAAVVVGGMPTRSITASIVLLLFALVFEFVSASGIRYRGASTGTDAVDFPRLAELGATHARVYVLWKYIEPKLVALDPGLSVAALQSNPSLIDEWAKTVDWSGVDQRLSDVAAVNVTAIIEVGEGTLNGLPIYNGGPADPNRIGYDLYCAYQYRTSRAVVRRYQHLYPQIRLYQIENELNEAYLAGFGGQRYVVFPATTIRDDDDSSGRSRSSPKELITQFVDSWRWDWSGGGAWANTTFLTQILSTLRSAIKDEDPTLLVTTNLHTDLYRSTHEALGGVPLYYEDAARLWSPLIDVWSFDSYPNMFVPQPLYTDRLYQVMTNLSLAAGDAPSGQQIICMETGYPVAHNTSAFVPVSPFAPNFTAWSAVNYSDTHQAEYAAAAYDTVKSHPAGIGFLYFKLQATNGWMLPPDGREGGVFSWADLATLAGVAEIYHDQQIATAVSWLLANWEDIIFRLPGIISQIGDGWGLLRKDGTPRPAFYALQKAFAAGDDQ